MPLTHAAISAAATAQPSPLGVRIGATRYYLRVTGAGIRLFYLSTEVAFILGGMANNVALVQTINTHALYRGNGYANVVALAFYAYWQAQGATHVSLGTNDTSGGFWTARGVHQNANTLIGTAIGAVANPINVPAQLAGVGAATV